MNSIIIPSLSEFVLRNQEKIKACYFLFLPLMNSMTKYFLDLPSPAAHALFLVLGGYTHGVSQLSQEEGTKICLCCWSLCSQGTYMSTSPHIWMESTQRKGKNYQMECRFGTIFLTLTPALTIQL